MKHSTIAVSLALKDIASVLDSVIQEVAGEKIGFTLMVFTEGRASYISTVQREDSVREIKGLLADWEKGMPDVPAHKFVSQPAVQQEPVKWTYPKNIEHLIRQLQTMDPAMPVHGAIHVEYQGEQRARIRDLSMSLERVAGVWIDQGNKAVPYSLVIWTGADERAAPAVQAQEAFYPEGEVIGPCVCGSWPGGKCLKCPRTAAPAVQAPAGEAIQCPGCLPAINPVKPGETCSVCDYTMPADGHKKVST